MHEGHRQRMLQRLQSAEGGLQDHELLEILLFNAIPRRNTNELAHRLLNSFGSLSDVLHADYEQLLEIDGVGNSTAAYLKSIGMIFDRMDAGKKEQPSAFNFKVFSEYLSGRFEGLSQEVLELYFLDAQDRIRRSARITSEENDRVRVAPSILTRFLITNRPYAMIVVHNHLGRDSSPSKEDNAFTAQLEMLCSFHNVKLRDHIIVSRGGVFSYFLSGSLQQIKKDFSVNNILEGKGL